MLRGILFHFGGQSKVRNHCRLVQGTIQIPIPIVQLTDAKPVIILVTNESLYGGNVRTRLQVRLDTFRLIMDQIDTARL